MAGIVVSVSKGVLDSVLEKLNNLIGDSCISLIGVSRDVQFLRDELPAISALLEKLEDTDELDPQVKVWRNQVREMSYDIEDCLDEFMNNMGSADAKAGFIDEVSHFLKTLRTRLQTAWQIKELKVRLQELGERRKRYKVDDCISNTTPAAVDPRLPALYNEAANLVGIDGPKKELTEWVMDVVQQFKVISIVGFGGLGKTTLANEVYREVGQQFSCKALVSVSQKPDIMMLLDRVLSQLGLNRPSSHACEVKDLIDCLRDYLWDKRYLIIVDDLWHVQAWGIIKCAFPNNDKQSRVIVTTRHVDVARACSSQHGCIHTMKPLGDQDSKKLFFKRIFSSEDACPPQFMEVSCEILKRCGGLPLAIITVASILACQPTNLMEHWQQIRNSLATRSATNPSLEDMMHILNLSYRSLSSQLKTCFLYLGTYPEDHWIERDDLVGKWVAEGFVSHPIGQEAWDIAQSYFNELVNRSMIQPGHKPVYIGKLYYKVHDMMLDLIASRCMENNFISLVHDPQATVELQNKVRRLTFKSSSSTDYTTSVFVSRQLTQVRSVSIFGPNCIPPLSHLKLLRVLSLDRPHDHEGVIDLTCLSQLPQLRYLKVSGSVDASLVLPNPIRSMRHLETLEIVDCRVLRIPPDIVDLPRLSRLIMSYVWFTMLPDGIGKLKLLRTLRGFEVLMGSSEIVKGLGELTNLAELYLRCDILRGETRGRISMPTTWMDAWSSSLQKLCNLRELYVDAFFVSCCADALSSWSSPPFPMLEVLRVGEWTFSRVPRWMGDLLKLRTLSFGVKEERNVSWDDIGIIGKLPCLVRLELRIEGNVPAGGIVIDGSTGFAALQYFELQIKSTSYLKFEAGAMPKLQEMTLIVDPYECDNATTSVGLEHLSSLKKITVYWGSTRAQQTAPEAKAKCDTFCEMFWKAAKALLPTSTICQYGEIVVPSPWDEEPGAGSADATS